MVHVQDLPNLQAKVPLVAIVEVRRGMKNTKADNRKEVTV